MRSAIRLAIAVLAVGLTQAAAAQPAERAFSRGGIPFVSGGVGVHSQERLKAMEGQFNLKLVFTLLEGNYVADVNVVVKEAAGKPVVEHFVEGPLFMAKLAAGTYSVDVTYENQSHSRKVKVGDRLRTEYFRWPSNPETDFPLPPESASGPKIKPKQ